MHLGRNKGTLPAGEPGPLHDKPADDAPADAGDVDANEPHEFVLGDDDGCMFCGHFADHPVHNAQLRA